MEDIWNTFPATMGEDQAWITFHQGFAEVAEADPRHNLLRVKVTFKTPTEHGMPTNEEFPQLTALDEALDEKISAAGGVYVGRVTVSGTRFLYFYVDIAESEALEIVEKVSKDFSYDLPYIYESDKSKQSYWDELYPTAADWQVIQDLSVLDNLSEHGDIKDKEREVMHWAYFPSESDCNLFTSWATGEGYVIHGSGKQEDSAEYLTKYSHQGTMYLGDVTSHTIKSNMKARELGGYYDGWETSIERE